MSSITVDHMTSSASPDPPPSKKRVTIRDIAAEAGVHFTTVSMALRNHPRLPAPTRKSIQKIAARLGYRPDPMLTALNAYRASRMPLHYQATIAWINNWPDRRTLLTIQQFQEYFEGARARAQELGYTLEEFWLHEPGVSSDRLHRILKARNISTLLIAPQPFDAAPFPWDYREFSAVAFGYSLKPSLLHVVTSHHFHSMNLIMQRLFELGYRRVGLIFPAGDDEKAENSCQGGLALSYLKWPQLQPIPPLLEEDPSDRELVLWLKAHRPDAVISFSHIARRLQALDQRFPRDLGFVSLDLQRDEKTLSGIYQNDEIIGRTAVDLVVAMLHRGERDLPKVPIRTLVESEWIPGKTLRRQP